MMARRGSRPSIITMPDKPKILIQLDTDPQPSVFDSVVAVDSGVDHLFRHSGVTVEAVQSLVYGAIFTRGVGDLRSTAIFVGGSDVAAGEALLTKIQKTFFGPMRVSVMMDSNGANTTAAAAVLAALRHIDAPSAEALVLGATGPVGQRAARLLAGAGLSVRVVSRSAERAEQVCRQIKDRIADARIAPYSTSSASELKRAIQGVPVVIAAGAPGVVLLPAEIRKGNPSLKVVIDLNAVPPLGIEGVELQDKAKERDGVFCYGALGVGGTKMKIHKAAIATLFQANDQVLDAEEIFEIGKSLAS